MTKLVYMFAGLMIGGAAVFGSLKYHVLRTNDGVTFVPKLSSTLEDTYVDVRQFGVTDWMTHRALVGALMQAKKGYVMETPTTESWKKLLPKS